jgi:beta-N-acetylhexosaminidase
VIKNVKRKLGTLSLCASISLTAGGGGLGNVALSGASDPSALSNPSASSDEITGILNSMTLEQKVGQMILAGIDGTSINLAAKKMIADQHVGGIIMFKNNFSDLSGSVRLVNALKKANKNNPVPLFISVDQEGGKISRLPNNFVDFPDNANVGGSDNADLAKGMGSLLAKELRIMGFNVDFAPVLDVNSNPNNPVIGNRSFGNNAKLVTKMGIAEMNGIRDGGIVAVVKHFPGHGDTSVDSHLDLPVVRKTTKQLEDMEWIPFRAAIDAKADAVMVAHILFPLIDNNAPASLSKIIIGEQLRGTLGYEGVVITDDMTMGAIAKNYGIEDAAILSVKAGSDILLIAHGYDLEKKVYDKLLSSVKSGQIKESRINESVRRILALKLKYNMSDQSVSTPTAADLPNDAIRKWLDKLKKSKH